MTTRLNLLLLALGMAGLAAPLCAQSGIAAEINRAPQQAAPAAEETHPYLSFELYPRWSQMTAARAVADIRLALQQAQSAMDAICRVTPETATFDNTFAAYEKMGETLECADTLLYHLSSVNDSPELREAQETLMPEISAFESSVSANKQLWQVLRTASGQAWVKELSPEKQRFVKQVCDSFRDSGADLPEDKKARKAEISQELMQLTNRFSRNVLDSTNAWELRIDDPAKLEGMSEDWMTQANRRAAEKGYGNEDRPEWLVTLDPTSVLEVLRRCDCAETRRLCWEGRNTVGKGGEYDNEAIVARVIELRAELAQLLGFASFADLISARRMVNSGDKATAFVDGMMNKVKPAFDRECAELLAFASAQKGEPLTAMDPWDISYYMRKLAEQSYNFDPESLRPYQSYDKVLAGMFRIASRLYDVSYTEVPAVCLEPGEELPEGKVEVWHPEVRIFKVTDNKTGTHLGSFYLDPFPRDTKRAGAWVLPLRFGEPRKGDTPHAPHLATLVGNMSAPVGDKPALFSHYDVETLFHEFGHMMHCMLGDTELKSHMGTSVAWDFVELPSQMNENWTWAPESMAYYARHWETGAPMPKEMQEKLLASRFFMPASDNMNQLVVAKLDLDIHTNYEAHFAGRPLDDATYELLRPWRMPATSHGSSMMRNLTHCISGGYAAGYYCYKWAEVLQADAFSRFKVEGILNPSTGADYRAKVLSQGDSKPAEELFRDFVGRDPNPDALLQEQGLLPEAPQR